ncbi:MAG TPA: FtsQ-type POTRA domain-containing protein [Candidatus Didemnitutus sp.]|nr:FtsQ-type POTRA domain-containing protein [Candidatus Didemnitutus sp.]
MSNEAAKSGRSWREIRQEVKPRAMSRKGRRRQRLEWFKLALLVLVVGGIAGTAYFAYRTWQVDRSAVATMVKSEPVREISVITDGTLGRLWVEELFALPKGATLMELDLPKLRNRLEDCGQIRRAVVTRSFPDMLVVTIQERSPVARLQVQDGGDHPRQLFVAKDGTVYAGVNYDAKMVATLPWLDGVRLSRAGNGYAPIAGMDSVAELLVTAQLQAPALYRDWMIVSLAHLGDRDEIIVKSQEIPEIIFSRTDDYFKQLARLDYITDKAHEMPEPGQIQSVNLALGGQVPVKVVAAPADATARPQPAHFNLQPVLPKRKEPRDL